MKSEFIQQYKHVWLVLQKIVENFDDNAWLGGTGYMMPARLAFHLLEH